MNSHKERELGVTVPVPYHFHCGEQCALIVERSCTQRVGVLTQRCASVDVCVDERERV